METPEEYILRVFKMFRPVAGTPEVKAEREQYWQDHGKEELRQKLIKGNQDMLDELKLQRTIDPFNTHYLNDPIVRYESIIKALVEFKITSNEI